MGGRGRGRSAPRGPAEQPAVAGRRSTRGQQQQQQQLQPQDQQADGGQHHQDSQIDPAITAAQNDSMPPPPVPAAIPGRSQEGRRVARRGAPRDNHRGESLASIHSVPGSSQELGIPTSPVPFHSPYHLGAPRPSSVLSESHGQQVARNKMMKKYLPQLKNASEDLTNHILTPPVAADGRDAWDEERKVLQLMFRTTRECYLSEPGAAVIYVNYVLQRIGAQRGDTVYSVATQIVSMANIAFVLDEMISIDSTAPLTIIQTVDEVFREHCVPEFPEKSITKTRHNGSEQFLISSERIVEKVMDIRIQLMFLSFEALRDKGQAPDPRQLMKEILLAEDVTFEQLADLSDDSQELYSKEIPGINLGVGTWERRLVYLRLRALYKELTELTELTGDEWQQTYSSLREVYSYEAFTVSFRQFLVEAFNETKLLIEGDALASQASQASEARIPVESQIQSQLEAEAFGGEGPAYNALRAVASGGLSNQDILAHQIQSSAYPPGNSVPYPNFAAYSDQPVQADGTLYAQSAAQSAAQALTAGRKRRAPSGGEANSVPAKKARGRRKQAADPPSSDPSAAFSESQYPPPPSSAAFRDTDFEAVSQRSREISAANRKAREPQVRSAWVRNDIRQLVKAVDVYKCKWSTIEKEIKVGTVPFGIPRDQQALRDKARLLKQDLLKADGVLPPSFDLVVLGKKEREAIKAVGKNPDRREADIDADGRPVNTEYNPNNELSSQPMPSATPAPASEAEAAAPAMPPAPMGAPQVESDLEPEQVAA